MSRPSATGRVPVVTLTGHLGAGKTTVLNHLLQQPGARVGVVVNDFGDVNVDAGLVTGQIDEPASISGGCLCCLPDAGGLDAALERLTHPRLGLDVVIVEASGIADPLTLSRMIRFSGVERVRPGGVVDVVDAVEHFDTVDTGGDPPARYAVTSLVVLNKTDRLPAGDAERTLDRIEARVHERNPAAQVVRTSHGRVDPSLVYDAASAEDPPDQLPLAALLRDGREHDHEHADAVTVPASGPVSPGRLVDLLEDPPPGAYRIKGRVVVDTGRSLRGYVVHVVGRSVHVTSRGIGDDGLGELVAIGMHLDVGQVRDRLDRALAPSDRPDAQGFARLQRYRRLSA
ncbi:CobW family GTP-binding protein [Promicromonospora iranensis]|uniref:G3E family GTPase n=1 Tax=Promicromonospora iranensis TaxID=1105144 RepID=A0ABU2CTP8_9MICO|nr:GTP-binding protein [Promicromonospora iranensis]MDR7384702.1 G3E family GTPase [Promicromonospora iranensis]